MTPAVVIVLDGGYLRSRHRRPERNSEVIAGKVLNLNGSQHRFAFARNGGSANEFANAIVSAGIRLGTPATVLSDEDAGLWKLQRQVMRKATLVLDWWHIARIAVLNKPLCSSFRRRYPAFQAQNDNHAPPLAA